MDILFFQWGGWGGGGEGVSFKGNLVEGFGHLGKQTKGARCCFSL